MALVPIGRSGRQAKLRGCIYTRFSTRWQHSTADQLRTCREWAEGAGIEVADRHVFSDEGTSGRTRRRAGLDALLAGLNAGDFDVVIAFATNRLFRKTHRALAFVEEQIVEKRRRCVFVSQKIDTADTKAWKTLMQIHAMMDEHHLTMTASQVQAAHQGLLLGNRVHNTLPFGYVGQVIPDQVTRLGKPSKAIAIDESCRQTVIDIFRWFVEDQLNYRLIARRLRDHGVLPPPKVDRWTWRAVRYLLSNPRYTGAWDYGRRENVWQSEGDYSRQFEREQPLRKHHDEKLRIIPDQLFSQAQARLAARKLSRDGRRSGKHSRLILADPLEGLLWCPVHDQALSPAGSNGSRLACRACKADGATVNLFSSADRNLVLNLLIKAVSERLLVDEAMVDEIVTTAEALAADAQQLRKLRQQRAEAEAQLKVIASSASAPEVPTGKELMAILNRAKRFWKMVLPATIPMCEAKCDPSSID